MAEEDLAQLCDLELAASHLKGRLGTGHAQVREAMGLHVGGVVGQCRRQRGLALPVGASPRQGGLLGRCAALNLWCWAAEHLVLREGLRAGHGVDDVVLRNVGQ